MTVALDQTVTVGGVTVAALVDTMTTARSFGDSVMVSGRKQPVAILWHRNKASGALAPDGSVLSPDEVNTLCPGAWETFTSQT